MREIVFDITEDAEDGGYCAAARGEGIFTQGDTCQELREMLQDATELYFSDEIESLGGFHLILNLKGIGKDTVDFPLANPLITSH